MNHGLTVQARGQLEDFFSHIGAITNALVDENDPEVQVREFYSR